jgi:secreted trypsin-like serine protease
MKPQQSSALRLVFMTAVLAQSLAGDASFAQTSAHNSPQSEWEVIDPADVSDGVEEVPDDFNTDDDGDGIPDDQEDDDGDGISNSDDLDYYSAPAAIPTVEVPARPADADDKDAPYSIGGNRLLDGDAPWQAQIYGPFTAESWDAKYRQGRALWQMQHKCGGTLISAEWVLTAAHCIDQKMVNQFYRIRLGATDISNQNAGSSYRIDRIVRHAGYANMYSNDIALVHIVADAYTKKIDTPRKIQALGLAPNVPKPGDTVFASGWGRVAPSSEVIKAGGNVRFAADGDFPNAILLKVDLAVMDQAVCAGLPGYAPVQIGGAQVAKIHAGVICAAKTGKATCKGDSGGPLVSAQNLKLVGIVSWGKDRCTGDGSPSIYTSIAYYRNWISRALQITDPLVSELE